MKKYVNRVYLACGAKRNENEKSGQSLRGLRDTTTHINIQNNCDIRRGSVC